MSVNPVPVWDKKQSVDIDDFRFNFERWLGADETITSATSTISPNDGSLVIMATVVANPRVVVWLSGGITGANYVLDVTFQTSSGRTLMQPSTVVIN